MATLVLLRGLMRDSRHWGEFLSLLQKKIALVSETDHKVLALDTLGNGALSSELSPTDIRHYAANINQRLLALDEDDIYLVGLSMGGMITLELLNNACVSQAKLELNSHGLAVKNGLNLRIKGAVVINSSAANLSSWYQRFQVLPVIKAMLDAVAMLFKHRANTGKLSLIEICVIKLTTRRFGNDLALMALWSRYRRDCRTGFLSIVRQLLACSRYKVLVKDGDLAGNGDTKAASIIEPSSKALPAKPLLDEVPLTLICGKNDNLVSPSCSMQLAQAYNAELLVFDDAGHDLSLDSPNQLCDAIIRACKLSMQ
ncbi:alpha/beta hydrolase [Shewanella sairae]|uniref:Alpha/beta hydrolase n=1 Tax=Shewanella sairae TaxID=190310 RepID=A0ABQ4PHL6_9GAMM|nr:alpha/beta hydrolase [Shewanella sairae]MCL1131306.1 alpha/beta hydrolase [Shewanella sairae]GIU47033.1 alpha/beta hydrolase [Shewanella sairae]